MSAEPTIAEELVMMLETMEQNVDNHVALAMVITNANGHEAENAVLSNMRRALRSVFQGGRQQLATLQEHPDVTYE